MYTIVGLGNPGDEYAGTRHNAGFLALDYLARKEKFPAWEKSKPHQGLITKGEFAGEDVLLLLPQTFMNKSGGSLKNVITSPKKAEKLIVVYDDIDVPLGVIKISYGRSSGGHRGLESIIKAVKTKDFVRVRVGITPTTPGGKLRKPHGGQAVQDFLLGDFKKAERILLEKVWKRVHEALGVIVEEGRVPAMNAFN